MTAQHSTIQRTSRLLRGTLAATGLAVLLVGVVTAQPGADPFGQLPKRTAEERQKLYPFRSVAERLQYEKDRREAQTLPPVLGPTAAKALDEADRKFTQPRHPLLPGSMRAESLKKLHSNEVEDFIKRDGFGLERLPRPSLRYLELQSPTFPLPNVTPTPALLANDRAVELPKAGEGLVGEQRLPSQESLSTLHWTGQYSFLNPDSFGYIRSRKEVSGFEAHAFLFNPNLSQLALRTKEPTPKVTERWQLNRLELVSVWKFEKPAVYVSAQLPRMEDLKKAPRRDLNLFEERGLKQLKAGEDTVTEATTNRIHMLGALRASKECLQCHQVQRGELLGAFSYELLRDPPLTGK